MKLLYSILHLNIIAFFLDGYAFAIPKDDRDDESSKCLQTQGLPKARKETLQAPFPSKRAYENLIEGMKCVKLQDSDYVSMIDATHESLRVLEAQNWDLRKFLSSYQAVKEELEKKRYAQLIHDNFYNFVHAIFYYFECAVGDAVFQSLNLGQTIGYGSLDQLGKIYQSQFKQQFSIVQGLWNECWRIFKYHSFVDGDDVCGVMNMTSQNKRVGFYEDQSGIVFYPIFSDQLLYIFPKYGDLREGNFRAFMIDRGQLLLESGFVLEYNEGTPYPYSVFFTHGATGENPFSRATTLNDIRIPNRRLLHDPEQRKIDKKFRNFFDFNQVEKIGIDFVPVPQTHAQYLETEYQFLKAIEAGAQNPRAENHRDALSQKAIIEERTKTPLQDHLQKIEEAIVDEYANEVRREQEELQEKRADEEKRRKEGKKKKKNPNHKKSKIMSEVSSQGDEVSSSEQIRSEARRRSTAFFESTRGGRLKWNKILRLLNGVFKVYPSLMNELNVNVAGSHITYHGSHEPITLVAPHGRGDTLSVGEVQTFVEGLIKSFMLQL